LLEAWSAAGVVGVQVIVVGAGAGAGAARWSGAVDVDVAGPGEPALRIPAGAFAQVGRAASAALARIILEKIGSAPGAVLELYAGSGNFTRFIVGRAARLSAWDADPAAVARGRRQVPQAAWLDRLPVPAAVDADLVLVDPPRDGMDDSNIAAATQARRRIVYVSCDPQTLARDAAKLGQAGFALADAVALDLMPHTFHVEVVATFDRRESGRG
jgi:23S rRNA (uracil1939-C5)-methyltransferase